MEKLDVSVPCPRCGEVMLAVPLALNALSRERSGVYVCSECGEDEAMRDFFGDAARAEWAGDEVGVFVSKV